jgi:hypothetical protein
MRHSFLPSYFAFITVAIALLGCFSAINNYALPIMARLAIILGQIAMLGPIPETRNLFIMLKNSKAYG